MSTLLAEVRQSWRLLGAYKELPTSFADATANANPLGVRRWFVARVLLWAAVACLMLGATAAAVAAAAEALGYPIQERLTWLAGLTAAGIGVRVGWWPFTVVAAGVLTGVAFNNGRLGLRPTSFEVLRMPSRRAWLIVCWCRALSALAALGCVGAVSLCFIVPPDWSASMAAGLLVFVLLPVVIGLLIGLCEALGVSGTWGASLGWLLVFSGALLRPTDQAWLSLLGVAAVAVVFAAAMVWLVGRREPWGLMAQPAGAAGPSAPRRRFAGPLDPPAWLRGRHGLFWSALAFDVNNWAAGWGGRLFRRAVALLLLVVALEPSLGEPWVAEGGPFGWLRFAVGRAGVDGLFAVLAALAVAVTHPLRFRGPPEVAVQSERLLVSLGATAAAWYRFRWRTWWLSPVWFVGVVVALALGPAGDRLAVLAVVLAGLLLRVAWVEHPFSSPRVGRGFRWAGHAVLYAGLCYLVGPGLDVVFLVFGAFALALAALAGLTATDAEGHSRARVLGASVLTVAAGFALAYGVYYLITLLPLWPSWTWAAAGVTGLFGAIWAVNQRCFYTEDDLIEHKLVWSNRDTAA